MKSGKDSDWPADHKAVRLIKFSNLDDSGRCSFELLWWQDGRRKAQCFFAKPEETRLRLLQKIKEGVS